MIGKDTKEWRYSAKQNCTNAGAYFCHFDTVSMQCIAPSEMQQTTKSSVRRYE